jgi:hypothetical protein
MCTRSFSNSKVRKEIGGSRERTSAGSKDHQTLALYINTKRKEGRRRPGRRGGGPKEGGGGGRQEGEIVCSIYLC